MKRHKGKESSAEQDVCRKVRINAGSYVHNGDTLSSDSRLSNELPDNKGLPSVSESNPSNVDLNDEGISRDNVASSFPSPEGYVKTNQQYTVDAACHNVQWPWIRLQDPKGRAYYYNALTSKTSWTITEASTDSPNCVDTYPKYAPPTAFNVSNAQKTWQALWQRINEAQDQPVPNSCHSESQEASVEIDNTKNDCLRNMSVYVEHYVSPSAQQLKRSARQQVKPPESDSLGYTQGYEEYNIWYGKHLTNRFDNSGPFGRREDRERALTRCNPFTDSGWTKCDLQPSLDRPVICIFFARGCCYLGSNCHYYHRLPTAEDEAKLDMLHDIFGRERFASHREDMDGVGTFSEDCKTLYVGDLKINRFYSNVEEKTEELIQQQFGVWGPIQHIKVIRNKNIAFIQYKHRVHAEFAKVAMAEQRLILDCEDDQICVKWAHPGRGNEDKPEEQNAAEWEMANRAMMTRLASLGYTQDDIECMIRWEMRHDDATDTNSNVTSKYPEAKNNLTNLSNGCQMTAFPLKEQVVDNLADTQELEELSSPASDASLQMYKMQRVLARIDAMNQDRLYSIDI